LGKANFNGVAPAFPALQGNGQVLLLYLSSPVGDGI